MELFHGGLREWYSQIVIDLKRGIDLLASFSWVDSKRLGYVGHSFGALFGGILVGIDPRIKTFILMAGVGSFTDVALLNMPDLANEELENFSKMMDPIDPIHYITQASSASLFFQFGRQDYFYPEKRFLEYYESARDQKKMEWYDAGHYLNDEALNDRIDWLVLKLNQTDNMDSLKQ
jgi:pimeloyl-ACP methyl ester carboxylesterase